MDPRPPSATLDALARDLRRTRRPRPTDHDRSAPCATADGSPGVPHLRVMGVARTVDDGTTILEPVSFTADRGEVVAIAGGSGAGKSSLLDLIAGVRPIETGRVLVDGRALTAETGTHHCGYVPQDDIVHLDLSLARTLHHAADLRLGDRVPARRAQVVARTVARVGLTDHLSTRVGSLSGGQRKRTCIAAELLDEPELFVLDEPTSGLDPASAADLMEQLRHLASGGATVVMTTHAPADLDRCDRIVFLAPGGRHVFTGSPAETRAHFGVEHLHEVYPLLDAIGATATSDDHVVDPPHAAAPWISPWISPSRPVGWVRQWRVVTVRTAELFVRNRLTAAILIGSPVMVIAMLAALFRPGALDVSQPASAAHVVFWIVFSAFFFGLTYGLLQIVTERAVVVRERAAGLRVGAYVAGKATVLVPFLAVVDAVMLWVLDLSGQLPRTDAADLGRLWGTLTLVSIAALGVGLLASALVRTPAQATLALPMLCFPQVLFAGAIVPVSEMAVPGRLLSTVLVGRWGFEALGRTLGIGAGTLEEPARGGVAASFDGPAGPGLAMLVAIAGITLGMTVRALRRAGRP